MTQHEPEQAKEVFESSTGMVPENGLREGRVK
jgi:hypothetical protein